MKRALVNTAILGFVVVFAFGIFSFLLQSFPQLHLQEANKQLITEMHDRQNVKAPVEEAPAIIASPVSVKKTVEITINHREFSPKEVTIEPGTTVVWTNQDWIRGEQRNAWPHMLKFDKLNLRSGKLKGSNTFSYTFTTPGSYRYIDSISPKILEGRIIVEDTVPALTGNVVRNPQPTNPAISMIAGITLLSITLGIFLGFNKRKSQNKQAVKDSKSSVRSKKK